MSVASARDPSWIRETGLVKQVLEGVDSGHGWQPNVRVSLSGGRGIMSGRILPMKEEVWFATDAALFAWLEENLPPEELAKAEEIYKEMREHMRERTALLRAKHIQTTVRVDEGRVVGVH